jgi:hypothetical protein
VTPRRRERPRPAASPSRTITLDAGALIAWERGDRWAVLLVDELRDEPSLRFAVPAGAAAQAYRDPPRQADLNRLLAHPRVETVPLDLATARTAGALRAARGTADVIDAAVVLCALARGGRVATTDPADLQVLAPGLVVIPPPSR